MTNVKSNQIDLSDINYRRGINIKKSYVIIGVFLIACVTVTLLAGVIWLTEPYISYGVSMDYGYRLDGNRWTTFNWISGNQSYGTLINVLCFNRGSFTGNTTC